MSIKAHQKMETDNKVNFNGELLEALLKLEQHVINNEFDESLLELLQHLQSGYDKEINTIVTECNDFDFDLATNHIRALISSLQPQT